MPLFVFNYKIPNDCILKKVCLIFLLYLTIPGLSAQDLKNHWVDSVFQTLSPQEKIGQLFMIPISSYASPGELDELKRQIKIYHFGGLFITRGGPESHARMINQLQALSDVPMLVAINAEWGLGQTMDSTMNFQKPLVLGAVQNDSLVYATGAEIARQMKLLGIHVNFAPHADIDMPSENSSIALRYFSNDKKRVAAKSVAFMRGLQDHGIIACAKHLPSEEKNGKENTSPAETLSFDLNRLDTLDFYPYQRLINEGVGGMLTTHLHFSAEEKKGLVPASLSELFISEILKKKIGFKGLTFTEIPYLQSTSGKRRAGETELLAFSVGNDVLISPLKPREAIKKIIKAMKKNPILKSQLDASVIKILETKHAVGLDRAKIISPDNLMSRLHSDEALLLQHRIAKAAVTLVRNASSSIPIKVLDNKHFISLAIGEEKQNEFNHYLSKYANLEYHSVIKASDTIGLKQKLLQADVVIVSLFPNPLIVKEIAPFIKQLASTHEVILCNFRNPLMSNEFEGLSSILEAYTEEDAMPKIAAQIIFGGLSAEGVLPINTTSLHEGQGLKTSRLDRFEYALPIEAGMDSQTLNKIKLIALEAIDSGATPGCSVLIAKQGKIVFDQSFGSLTYENNIPVNDQTIYDLASITKVAGTLQAVMFLYERGVIDINKKASLYLPELLNTNKKDIILKDILTHQSGLFPFLLMWPQTVKGESLSHYYSTIKNENYPLQVAPNLFAAKLIQDSVWQWVLKSEMLVKPARTPYSLRYSDLGFMILHRMVEQLVNQPMEDFLSQNLYEPLGASTVGYLPLTHFPLTQIAPSEMDTLFRKSLVLGTVHDERAAMLGGVAGHAGLFGSANDLIKIGQMLLQKGNYGGHSFYKSETVELFSQKQFENSSRGLGWAKSADPSSPASRFLSPKGFGHTGFTGTCIWIDPEFDLVFVFLSNSRFPDRRGKLNRTNIRSRIQDEVYQSFFNFCQYGITRPDEKLISKQTAN